MSINTDFRPLAGHGNVLAHDLVKDIPFGQPFPSPYGAWVVSCSLGNILTAKLIRFRPLTGRHSLIVRQYTTDFS